MRHRTLALTLILLAAALGISGCDDGPSALTAPEQSLDFSCFNPSNTSLECTGSVVTLHPVLNFDWQATGQAGINGRAAVGAAWNYSRFCAVQVAPQDVTVTLTVFLENGDQLGPRTKLYMVCLNDAQTASTQSGVLDPLLVARGYDTTIPEAEFIF